MLNWLKHIPDEPTPVEPFPDGHVSSVQQHIQNKSPVNTRLKSSLATYHTGAHTSIEYSHTEACVQSSPLSEYNHIGKHNRLPSTQMTPVKSSNSQQDPFSGQSVSQGFQAYQNFNNNQSHDPNRPMKGAHIEYPPSDPHQEVMPDRACVEPVQGYDSRGPDNICDNTEAGCDHTLMNSKNTLHKSQFKKKDTNRPLNTVYK